MSLLGNIFRAFSSSDSNDKISVSNSSSDYSFFDEVTWYCDGCNCVLNEQEDFDTSTGIWYCTECGYENDVSSENIYDSEEDFQQAMGIPKCPWCGSTVVGDSPDALKFFNCNTCGGRFFLEDGELVNVFDRGKKDNDHICENCGESLAGGNYTAPWEDGDNYDGYVTCPHCGYNNYIYEDD